MKSKKWSSPYLILSLFIITWMLLFGVTTNTVFAESDLKYPKTLRFAALKPGAVLYAVNSGLAKVASDNSPMTLLIVPTTGSSTWYPMLSKLGSADLAVDNLTVFWQMWHGLAAPDPIPKGFPPNPPYEKRRNIRILIAGLVTHVGMLTRKDSGLKDVSDLKGKKIAWEWSGFPPAVSITLANLLNGGLTLDDVKGVPIVEVVAGVKAAQEGRIHATTAAVGMGTIAEADALVGMRFLRTSMDPERIKLRQQAMPGCYTSIKKGGVPGVPEDTPIWTMNNGVLVSTRMEEHVAYKLVETWWEHHQEYAPIHRLLSTWTPDKFVNENVTVPYHEGAVKFYKERDVWSPKMEEIQNRLLSGN